jgi:type II secretory pathway component PulC
VDKVANPPLPKPEFVLYGVLITDDASVAYVEDKKALQSTAGRGERQVALRKGETLSGFTLTEIGADKIVMVRGDEIITVNLSEPKVREVAKQPKPPGGTLAIQRKTAMPPSQPLAQDARKTFLDFFRTKGK